MIVKKRENPVHRLADTPLREGNKTMNEKFINFRYEQRRNDHT